MPASNGSSPRRSGVPVWRDPHVLATVLLAVAAGYAQFGVSTVFGDVAETFGASGAQDLAREVGLTATTVGVGLAIVRLAAIGSLPLVSLADRSGRRRLLLRLAAAGLILTAVSTLSPGYWLFVAVIACARPLLSSVSTLTTVVVAEETGSADRSTGVAMVTAAYALGSGLVALVHGSLSDSWGFRGVLALSAALLLVVPLVARWVQEPSIFHDAAPVGTRLGTVRAELRPRLALVAGLAGAMSLVTGPAFTFLFVYGENVRGVSSGSMALLVLTAGPTGLLGLALGRWVADHRGRRVGAGVAMVVVALGATATYSGTTAGLAAGYLVTIVASAAFGPAAGALLAEVFPTSERATASGWAAVAGVLGSVAGLALFGVLSDVFGSFAVAAAVLFLPVTLVAAGYAALPETRGVELDAEFEPAGSEG